MLDVLHDDAWVREIGGFQAVEPASFGWLAGEKQIWFLSERDGWMHLYAIDALTGGAPRQLTQGKWEIESVTLSLDKKTFYINKRILKLFDEQLRGHDARRTS